jgi:hypothetical protein
MPEPTIGEFVPNPTTLCLRYDQTTAPQTGQMIRQLGARHTQPLSQIRRIPRPLP